LEENLIFSQDILILSPLLNGESWCYMLPQQMA